MNQGDGLLEIKEFSYTYPGAAAPVFDGVSLILRRGECLCLTGPSGCGKTTLLLAVKRLLRGGIRRGEIIMADRGGDRSELQVAGLVFQNAESQILCTTVAEEIAFGPENLCVPPDQITRRVFQSLQSVNLTQYENRSVEQLSAGQKQRLTIASVLAMEARLLLLDEPTSQLDRQGKEELFIVLKSLKQQGFSFLIAAHDLEPLREIVDRTLLLNKGTVRELREERSLKTAATQRGTSSRRDANRDGLALVCRDLCFSYPETGKVLENINLAIFRGERIHLSGRNGAGKSSLLRCLVGMETPDSGEVMIAGLRAPQPASLLGKVGLLVQNPTRQLFEDTVAAEVAFSLKKLSRPAGELTKTVAETLITCEIRHLAERAPLTLSFGEQHRVALAAVLAPRPEVLLLDEPFAGLDGEQQQRLLEILAGLPERFGTTVIIASHDPLPSPLWADRELRIEEGFLAEAA